MGPLPGFDVAISCLVFIWSCAVARPGKFDSKDIGVVSCFATAPNAGLPPPLRSDPEGGLHVRWDEIRVLAVLAKVGGDESAYGYHVLRLLARIGQRFPGDVRTYALAFVLRQHLSVREYDAVAEQIVFGIARQYTVCVRFVPMPLGVVFKCEGAHGRAHA